MKEYTNKQIVILVAIILFVIAFLNTSHAVWSSEFLRQFGLNIIGYSAASVVIWLIWSSTINMNEEHRKREEMKRQKGF